MTAPTLRHRTSGILLHATSLPGPHGNGDLGAEAHAFVETLARAGQRWWQMLPIGPPGYGDSPYSAHSAFAGSPLLVDLDALDVPVDHARLPVGDVDFAAARAFRERHLRRAFDRFASSSEASPRRSAHAEFCAREAGWLDEFALFEALKRAHDGAAWVRWGPDVRLRRPRALARARNEHAEEIAFAKFVQFHFDEQWRALRAHCAERGIGLMGDVPIFVAHDSADVWEHQELFELEPDGELAAVAGVPPDYFSVTGQRWGNPLYRWPRMRATGYAWWVERFRAALARFDAIRLDHFIGFVRYWRIPARDPTAMNGAWRPGPGRAFFDRVREALGELPLVAEDLGAVTPAVTRLRRALGFPGTGILQFAFGSDVQAPKFLPHNLFRNRVVYTGTHDNDTLRGWLDDPGGGADDTRSSDEAAAERARALAYLGFEPDGDPGGARVCWALLRLLQASVAHTAIIPMQDVLGLGSAARMNRPGKPTGNWGFRLDAKALTPELEARLLDVARTYGRAP
jgi:4-alpha-glucanotransferase